MEIDFAINLQAGAPNMSDSVSRDITFTKIKEEIKVMEIDFAINLQAGAPNMSDSVSRDITFTKIKEEIKSEYFSEDELGEACAESVKTEFSSAGVISCQDYYSAEGQVFSESSIHPENLIALTQIEGGIDVEVASHLSFDLLPSCSVLLQRVNVSLDKRCCTNKTSRLKRLPFRCPLCVKTFSCKYDWKTHVSSHTGRKGFSCSYCDARFRWESSLNRHRKLHLEERPRCLPNFRTDSAEEHGVDLNVSSASIDCDVSSASIDHDVSSDGINKKYFCALCPYKFSRKDHLKSHMLVHSKKKPYSCKFCNAKFKRKDGLLLHTRTHSGERPYSCSSCGATFVQKSHLKTHMNTHSDAKHSCSVCNRQFSQEIYLTRHRRTHTGERPYSCTFCNKRFVNTSSLSRHVRRHTGRKPYSCAECGDKFNLKESLKLHFSNCH